MGLNELDCTDPCPKDCEWVFGRVRVRPTIVHGTWVEWLLHPQFDDPEPYEYQLQVGHTGLGVADDWKNIGLPATNVSVLLDDEKRIFGKTQWTHYRVCLTTPNGTYFSAPQHTWGDLPFRFWRLVQNRERQLRKQFERTVEGQQGWLLKRKLTGITPEPGEGTIDYMTFEVTNPQDPETVGTEFIGGYYAPIPCVYADLDRVARREHLDEGKARGTINDQMRVKAKMLAVPQIDSYDVWVDNDTDFRWEIHAIQHLEEMEGVPIIVSAEFRLLPFTHPVYEIEIADQLPTT